LGGKLIDLIVKLTIAQHFVGDPSITGVSGSITEHEELISGSHKKVLEPA
jgi:hypothetical protein